MERKCWILLANQYAHEGRYFMAGQRHELTKFGDTCECCSNWKISNEFRKKPKHEHRLMYSYLLIGNTKESERTNKQTNKKYTLVPVAPFFKILSIHYASSLPFKIWYKCILNEIEKCQLRFTRTQFLNWRMQLQQFKTKLETNASALDSKFRRKTYEHTHTHLERESQWKCEHIFF